MDSLTSISCIGKVLHQEDQSFLSNMEDLICFLCSQSDTKYYDQAISVPDRDKNREAMLKEIATNFERQH